MKNNKILVLLMGLLLAVYFLNIYIDTQGVLNHLVTHGNVACVQYGQKRPPLPEVFHLADFKVVRQGKNLVKPRNAVTV